MQPNQLQFMDPVSPTMCNLIILHDQVMVVVVFIMILVLGVSMSIMSTKMVYRFKLEVPHLELIWTVFPALILVLMAIPSFRLLYSLMEEINPYLTLKVVGHQWYWSYEYPDILSLNFDSYMIPSQELKDGAFRLLEVDSRVVLPIKQEVRALISSFDVLHAWAVPSLGVKMDAVPGRMNQINFMCNQVGVYYGQCSEICGANHSFMPIGVEVVNETEFLSYKKYIEN